MKIKHIILAVTLTLASTSSLATDGRKRPPAQMEETGFSVEILLSWIGLSESNS